MASARVFARARAKDAQNDVLVVDNAATPAALVGGLQLRHRSLRALELHPLAGRVSADDLAVLREHAAPQLRASLHVLHVICWPQALRAAADLTHMLLLHDDGDEQQQQQQQQPRMPVLQVLRFDGAVSYSALPISNDEVTCGGGGDDDDDAPQFAALRAAEVSRQIAELATGFMHSLQLRETVVAEDAASAGTAPVPARRTVDAAHNVAAPGQKVQVGQMPAATVQLMTALQRHAAAAAAVATNAAGVLSVAALVRADALRTLTCLELRACGFGIDDAIALERALLDGRALALRRLDLSRNAVGDGGVSRVVNALCQRPDVPLSELVLSRCKVSDVQSLAALLRRTQQRHLLLLDLSSNRRINAASIVALAEALKRQPSNEPSESGSEEEKLQTLELSDCRFTAEVGAALARLLEALPLLGRLVLDGNGGVGNDLFRAVRQQRVKAPKLRELQLQQCRVSGSGGAWLGNALVGEGPPGPGQTRRVPQLTALVMLDLSCCEDAGNVAIALSERVCQADAPALALTELRFENCDMRPSIAGEGRPPPDDALAALAAMLVSGHVPRLTTLRLGGTPLGATGLETLARSVATTTTTTTTTGAGAATAPHALHTLSVNGCGVTGPALAAVLRAFAPSLTELDASRNELGDDGVYAVAESAARDALLLKQLDVEGTAFGVPGADALARWREVAAVRQPPLRVRVRATPDEIVLLNEAVGRRRDRAMSTVRDVHRVLLWLRGGDGAGKTALARLLRPAEHDAGDLSPFGTRAAGVFTLATTRDDVDAVLADCAGGEEHLVVQNALVHGGASSVFLLVLPLMLRRADDPGSFRELAADEVFLHGQKHAQLIAQAQATGLVLPVFTHADVAPAHGARTVVAVLRRLRDVFGDALQLVTAAILDDVARREALIFSDAAADAVVGVAVGNERLRDAGVELLRNELLPRLTAPRADQHRTTSVPVLYVQLSEALRRPLQWLGASDARVTTVAFVLERWIAVAAGSQPPLRVLPANDRGLREMERALRWCARVLVLGQLVVIDVAFFTSVVVASLLPRAAVQHAALRRIDDDEARRDGVITVRRLATLLPEVADRMDEVLTATTNELRLTWRRDDGTVVVPGLCLAARPHATDALRGLVVDRQRRYAMLGRAVVGRWSPRRGPALARSFMARLQVRVRSAAMDEGKRPDALALLRLAYMRGWRDGFAVTCEPETRVVVTLAAGRRVERGQVEQRALEPVRDDDAEERIVIEAAREVAAGDDMQQVSEELRHAVCEVRRMIREALHDTAGIVFVDDDSWHHLEEHALSPRQLMDVASLPQRPEREPQLWSRIINDVAAANIVTTVGAGPESAAALLNGGVGGTALPSSEDMRPRKIPRR